MRNRVRSSPRSIHHRLLVGHLTCTGRKVRLHTTLDKTTSTKFRSKYSPSAEQSFVGGTAPASLEVSIRAHASSD